LQFVFRQREPREDLVFLRHEIGDQRRAGGIHGRHLLCLLCALQREVQLRGQCITAGVAVEALEKRVVLGPFEQCVH
jgi:hypothetical protein